MDNEILSKITPTPPLTCPTSSAQAHSASSRDDSTPISTNPSQLFIGEQGALHDYALEYVQKQLCAHQGCNVCATCHSVRTKNHYSMRWITSEKMYTREEFAPLFHTLSFALDTDELFFIVIEKADYLTTACANSLLKTLEEPPAGYRFLLLTDRLDQILPTIRSRCTTRFVQPLSPSLSHDALFHFFTNTTLTDPTLFLKTIDKEKPSEQRTSTLLNHLLAHWISRYQDSIRTNDSEQLQLAESIITILSDTLKHPLMPGSSKILLKNLFLQIKS